MLIVEENLNIVIIFLIYLLSILLAYIITKKNYNNYAFYLLLIPFYNIWLIIKTIFISSEKSSNHIYSDNTTSKTSIINKTVLLSINNTLENITLYEGNSLIIGRETSIVDFVIDSHYVSKKHLLIWSKNSLIYVKAFPTTNGTYIDGKILEPNISYPLREGEKLIIGSEEAIYIIDRINDCDIF